MTQAVAADAPVVLVNHPEAPHGFDNREATLRTRSVLRLALEFLKETLRPGDRL